MFYQAPTLCQTFNTIHSVDVKAHINITAHCYNYHSCKTLPECTTKTISITQQKHTRSSCSEILLIFQPCV